MDLSQSLAELNYVAVLLAAIASFAVGSAWYHDSLFGKQWKKLVGLKKSDLKKVNMNKLMAAAFAVSLVTAGGLSVILENNTGPLDGFVDGAFIGFVIAAMTIGMNYLYEQKKPELWYINGGYAIVSLAVMGLVLGLFV